MTDKNIMKNEELEKVTGGATNSATPSATTPKYSVGDKVTVLLYPEFGVGSVTNVYLKNSMWNCQVRFDSGLMDASQDEFAPA